MINYIVAMLITLSIAAFTGCTYLLTSLRRRSEESESIDREYGFVISILGVIAAFLGLHMITTYPIEVPNTPLHIYNEVFGIPYSLFWADGHCVRL